MVLGLIDYSKQHPYVLPLPPNLSPSPSICISLSLYLSIPTYLPPLPPRKMAISVEKCIGQRTDLHCDQHMTDLRHSGG